MQIFNLIKLKTSKHEQKLQKQVILIKATGKALLVSLPIIFVANGALAMPWIQLEKRLSQAEPSAGTSTTFPKPRPSTFNEAPNNLQQRTSPTDSDKQMQPLAGDLIQPPLPESQQLPSAMVTPVNGKINIKLINTTKAVVDYQVIGDTNQRTLQGNSDVTLQNIKTPVSVTFGRKDKGLLGVNAKAISSLLEVSLDETTNLDEDKSTLVVQPNGAVFIN